jgi:hypothetical protein
MSNSDSNDEFQLKLEAIKWHQKIQELTYLEAGSHMRSLNQLMWQVPSLVVIINGGLWYGSTMMSIDAARVIFLFCAVFDTTSIITLYRLRGLIGDRIKIQANIEDLYHEGIFLEITQVAARSDQPPESKKKIKDGWSDHLFNFIDGFSRGKYTVIGCWTIMLMCCLFINVVGVFFPSLYLDKEPQKIIHEYRIESPYVIIDTSKI